MKKIKAFVSAAEKYKEQADFVSVYIREAHPSGTLRAIPFNKYKIRDHKTFQDRLDAAERLKSDVQLSVPILVDTMKDEAAKSYAAVPDRLYVVLNGTVTFQGHPGPFQYSITAMEKALNKMVNEK